MLYPKSATKPPPPTTAKLTTITVARIIACSIEISKFFVSWISYYDSNLTAKNPPCFNHTLCVVPKINKHEITSRLMDTCGFPGCFWILDLRKSFIVKIMNKINFCYGWSPSKRSIGLILVILLKVHSPYLLRWIFNWMNFSRSRPSN